MKNYNVNLTFKNVSTGLSVDFIGQVEIDWKAQTISSMGLPWKFSELVFPLSNGSQIVDYQLSSPEFKSFVENGGQ